MTPARSIVAGVAWIAPANPSLTSFGSSPEWSMWAWLSTTAAIREATKGKGR
jgi:hypothetical protein